MSRRNKRLLLVASGIIAVSAVWWGCTQPEDVFFERANTRITLDPERLPDNPPGMLYELWVVRDSTDTTPESFISLGKFGYENKMNRFLDPTTGLSRADDKTFILRENILNFQLMLVTVEGADDQSPDEPGPTMLLDTITIPDINDIRLRFRDEDSLWNAFSYFNMETTSDSDRDSSDGYGLWFCTYRLGYDSVRDTLDVDSSDPSLWQWICDTLPDDTVVTYIAAFDSIYKTDTIRVLGTFDTVVQQIVRWDAVYETDSVPPIVYCRTPLDTTVWVVGPAQGTEDSVTGDTLIAYDLMTQANYPFIDYTAHGWHYKGWVLSPAVPADCGSGHWTKPPWPMQQLYQILYLYQSDWYWDEYSWLISTGTFGNIAAPDDLDTFALGSRTPPFPGEDFLDTDCGPIELVNNNDLGMVMITLEPENFNSDTTNFPLFVVMQRLPFLRSQLSDTTNVQEYRMETLVRSVPGDLWGWPAMNVSYELFSEE